MQNDFTQDSLVILAHGSSKNAHSASSAREHTETLRNRKLFKEVEAGYWKQAPFIKEVLPGVSGRRVFIVPLFISAGFFSEEKIPAELGFGNSRVLGLPNQTLYYCKPIGTHQGISEVVLARAKEVVAEHPFPFAPAPKKIALFIAGHGTEQNADSRKSIEAQVAHIRSLDLYAEVHALYMDEEPRISDYHTMTTCKNVVVVPFFISDGLHSFEEIPVLLGEPQKVVQERFLKGQPTWRNPCEKFGKLVWYSRSVGSHPAIADFIYERAVEALTK